MKDEVIEIHVLIMDLYHLTKIQPRTMWNHFKNFATRTTNHLEGWHRAINSVARKKKLNIFEMIKLLQREEAKFKIVMLQLRMGQAPPRKCRKYEKINNTYMRLVQDFEDDVIDLREFVHTLGYNL